MTGFAPAWTCLQDRCLSQSSHIGSQQERSASNTVHRLWRPSPLPKQAGGVRLEAGGKNLQPQAYSLKPVVDRLPVTVQHQNRLED